MISLCLHGVPSFPMLSSFQLSIRGCVPQRGRQGSAPMTAPTDCVSATVHRRSSHSGSRHGGYCRGGVVPCPEGGSDSRAGHTRGGAADATAAGFNGCNGRDGGGRGGGGAGVVETAPLALGSPLTSAGDGGANGGGVAAAGTAARRDATAMLRCAVDSSGMASVRYGHILVVRARIVDHNHSRPPAPAPVSVLSHCAPPLGCRPAGRRGKPLRTRLWELLLHAPRKPRRRHGRRPLPGPPPTPAAVLCTRMGGASTQRCLPPRPECWQDCPLSG